MSYELRLEPERMERNPLNGQWLPGHTSPTKGRKRTDFMSENTDRRLRAMASEVFRTQQHPEGAGVPRRRIIAVDKNGKWLPFPPFVRQGGNLE